MGKKIADSQDSTTPTAGSNQVDTSVVTAVRTLADFARAMGVKLEFIKFSGPTGFKSVYGVDFREHIYEDEADYWRYSKEPVMEVSDGLLGNNSSNGKEFRL